MTTAALRGRPSVLAIGLAIAALFTVLDIATASAALIGLVVFAPLACALLGDARDTAIVGVTAIALAAMSVFWEGDVDLTYGRRLLVVAAIGVISWLAARNRARIGRDRERFGILAALAEIADGTRSLSDTVAGLHDLVVPTFADVCVVDAVSGGELQRLAVRAAGPAGERQAAALALRPPATADRIGDARRPRLLTIDEEVLRQVATDDDDLAALRALRARSALIVPLRARGRRLGTLSLIVTEDSGRRYDEEDLEFGRVLAGRAALALDNAGLHSELEATEAQLTAALSTLAEAVTVQRPDGSLVYANEAAARMLGFGSAEQLIGARVDLADGRFRSTHDDGSPVRAADLPGHRLLAGEPHPAPLVVRTVDRESGEPAWRVMKASGVFDPDGSVKLVVNVIEDITEVKRAELTQRLLARAGEVLSSSLDQAHLLQGIAEVAVPQLADWCALSMPDGRGTIRSAAIAHADPAKVAFARSIGERYPTPADAQAGVAQVLRDGRAQLVTEITDEMLTAVAHDDEHLELLRRVGARAAVTVPMSAGGKVVGALSLVSAESGRTFGEADVALAEDLGRRAGTAIENARLYAERSHIAHTLQTGLLPDRLPPMPGWSAATLYRPAGDENRVGGDFYDAFPVPGGWLALVGDVAGRGAAAAALTGLARHTLRTAARLLDDPLDAVRTLNDELLAREPMSLCSIGAVVLSDAADGGASAEVLCAGHPLPLLVRGEQVEPVGVFSPMLGAYPIETWTRTTVALEPGDVLVLITDGVIDAVGEHERFGEERLAKTLAGASDAGDAVARIDAALHAFIVGAQADDTAILAVQRVPVAAIAPTP